MNEANNFSAGKRLALGALGIPDPNIPPPPPPKKARSSADVHLFPAPLPPQSQPQPQPSHGSSTSTTHYSLLHVSSTVGAKSESSSPGFAPSSTTLPPRKKEDRALLTALDMEDSASSARLYDPCLVPEPRLLMPLFENAQWGAFEEYYREIQEASRREMKCDLKALHSVIKDISRQRSTSEMQLTDGEVVRILNTLGVTHASPASRMSLMRHHLQKLPQVYPHLEYYFPRSGTVLTLQKLWKAPDVLIRLRDETSKKEIDGTT